MTDVATPEHTSHRRLYFVLAAVLVVVIALIAGLFFYASSAAGSKASDYDDAYASWKTKDKPVLLDATRKVPSGTFVRDDTSTARSLATQKKGCDAVAASRKKLSAAADRLPTLGSNGVLGTISSDYTDAVDASARRENVVRAYTEAASDTLAQIERDCRWNIAYNAKGTKPSKLAADSGKYLMKAGAEAGVTCSEKLCISSITKKKNTYADLLIKSLKLRKAGSLALLRSEQCEATSYGQACDELAKAYAAGLKVNLDFYTYVRQVKSTVDNDGIDTRRAKIEKVGKANTKTVRKAVLALNPDLRKDKQVRAYPSWTDHFFARMGRLQLADLESERAAIDKL